MRDAITVAIVLVVMSSAALAGCKKGSTAKKDLPPEVPYHVKVSELSKSGGYSSGTPLRANQLAGLELLLAGKPVAKLREDNTTAWVVAEWKGPKAGVRDVLNGKFSLRGTGACGPFELAVTGPPDVWKTFDEPQLAARLDKDGLGLSLEATLPASHEVVIDRGSSAATVKVGETAMEKGAKSARFAIEGCTKPVPVIVDGKSIGELDPKAPAHLITLEPGVCHVVRSVGYGKYEGGPATRLPAKPLLPLPQMPIHILEPAPDSQRVGGGGTVSSELLRDPC